MSWGFGEDLGEDFGEGFLEDFFVVLRAVSLPLPQKLLQKSALKSALKSAHKLDTGAVANSNAPSFDCKHARLIFTGTPPPRPQEESTPNEKTHTHTQTHRHTHTHTHTIFFSAVWRENPLSRNRSFEKEGHFDKFWGHLQRNMALDQQRSLAWVHCCNPPYDTPPSWISKETFFGKRFPHGPLPLVKTSWFRHLIRLKTRAGVASSLTTAFVQHL